MTEVIDKDTYIQFALHGVESEKVIEEAFTRYKADTLNMTPLKKWLDTNLFNRDCLDTLTEVAEVSEELAKHDILTLYDRRLALEKYFTYYIKMYEDYIETFATQPQEFITTFMSSFTRWISAQYPICYNTPLCKVLFALYLDSKDVAIRASSIKITMTSGTQLYEGPADKVPEKLLSQHWEVVSVTPEPSVSERLPKHKCPKIIEVI